MRYVLIFICFACSCVHSGALITPLKIHFSEKERPVITPLTAAIAGAQKEVSCVFSEGYLPVFYREDAPLSGYEKESLALFQAIQKQNLPVSVLIPSEKQCTEPGFLSLRYPSLLTKDNVSSFENIYRDCSSQSVSNSSKITLTQGEIKYNFCIIDRDKTFLLSDSIGQSPPHFLFEIHSPEIASMFFHEFTRLENGIFGKWKKASGENFEFRSGKDHIRILWNPQDQPLEYLQNRLTGSSVLAVLSRIDNDPNGLPAVLQGLAGKKKLRALFFHNHAFHNNSFFSSLNHTSCRDCYRLFDSKKPDSFHVFLLGDHNAGSVIVLGRSVSDTSKYSDSFLLEIKSTAVFKKMKKWYVSLEKNSYPVLKQSPAPSFHDVLISEILWQGSIDNDNKKHTTDEFIELKNKTGSPVDLSGWVFACTEDGANASSKYIFPAGARITDYLVAGNGKAAFADIPVSLQIRNGTKECMLLDGSPGPSYYNDPEIHGNIVDLVLSTDTPSWNTYASFYFSRTGFNTLKYSLPSDGARSMERIEADGRKLSSWQTNSNLPESNYFVRPGYRLRTFATPGAANSILQAGEGIYISEIHWMGAYDNAGTSFPENEFIEIFNGSGQTVSIGGYVFGCAYSPSDARPLFGIPYGVSLKPMQTYTVLRLQASAFSGDRYADYAISETAKTCVLINPAVPSVFLGFDGPDTNSVLDGHYDHPLLTGEVIDQAGDFSLQFGDYMGLNDTLLKIRRSACRRLPRCIGTTSCWQTNALSNGENTMVYPPFADNTFASPGF